jgi:hypothetical protein
MAYADLPSGKTEMSRFQPANNSTGAGTGSALTGGFTRICSVQDRCESAYGVPTSEFNARAPGLLDFNKAGLVGRNKPAP